MANEAASRHRVATAVLALLTVGAGFVTDSLFRTPLQPMKTAVAVGGPPSPEARVVVEKAPFTDTQQELVNFGLDRFEGQGLSLPEIEFEFFPTTLDCEGHMGYYLHASRTLRMCSMSKSTLLHELAHAWANINLSRAERASFASYRGLNAWNDDGDVWKERGTEHAAEIIAWALMDEADHVRFTTTMPDGSLQAEFRLLAIDNSRVEALYDGFVELTGMEPVFRYPAEWDSTALETQWQARMSAMSSPEA
jgi:hypothetical protein